MNESPSPSESRRARSNSGAGNTRAKESENYDKEMDFLAILEMNRVLKPGGRLILLDHVRSSVKPIFWLREIYEFILSRTKGEYMTRRPALHVMATDFDIKARDRMRAGIVKRLVALKLSDKV